MPINTTQISDLTGKSTIADLTSKVNEVISTVNQLPSTVRGDLTRLGGVIDGESVGSIPSFTTGSLEIINTGSLVITGSGGIINSGTAGLTVNGGPTSLTDLSTSGSFTANSGATVTNGDLVTEAITASGLITGTAGATISGGTLTTGAITSSGLIHSQGNLDISAGQVLSHLGSLVSINNTGISISTGSELTHLGGVTINNDGITLSNSKNIELGNLSVFDVLAAANVIIRTGATLAVESGANLNVATGGVFNQIGSGTKINDDGITITGAGAEIVRSPVTIESTGITLSSGRISVPNGGITINDNGIAVAGSGNRMDVTFSSLLQIDGSSSMSVTPGGIINLSAGSFFNHLGGGLVANNGGLYIDGTGNRIEHDTGNVIIDDDGLAVGPNSTLRYNSATDNIILNNGGLTISSGMILLSSGPIVTTGTGGSFSHSQGGFVANSSGTYVNAPAKAFRYPSAIEGSGPGFLINDNRLEVGTSLTVNTSGTFSGYTKTVGRLDSIADILVAGDTEQYINFHPSASSPTVGVSGYGIRDNNGAMEAKSSGGAWGGIYSSGQVSGDGTYFESGEVTASTKNSVLHGLGQTPRLINVILRAVAGNLGYELGDEVQISASMSGAVGSSGVGLFANTTYITTVVGAGGIYVIRADTGGENIINPANWRFVIRAWK